MLPCCGAPVPSSFECPCTGRSMSAAADAIGAYHSAETCSYRQCRARLSAPLQQITKSGAVPSQTAPDFMTCFSSKNAIEWRKRKKGDAEHATRPALRCDPLCGGGGACALPAPSGGGAASFARHAHAAHRPDRRPADGARRDRISFSTPGRRAACPPRSACSKRP